MVRIFFLYSESFSYTMYMCKAVAPMLICALIEHARIQKIFSGGGGGGVQIPRRGLTENFNMAKINNLAIPRGGGGPDPMSPPPLWIRPCRKSGFSHCISCLRILYPLQIAAVQENLLLSGCIYTLKTYTTKQLRLCKMTALLPGKPPRT